MSATRLCITIFLCIYGCTGSNIPRCIQGVTCIAPSCRCPDTQRTELLSLDKKKRPRLVALTFDGNVSDTFVNNTRYMFASKYNPNGCAISGTLFVPFLQSDFHLVKNLYDFGLEIGLLTDKSEATGIENVARLKTHISNYTGIPLTDIRGWRQTSTTETTSEEQTFLVEQGLEYESSPKVNNRDTSISHYDRLTLTSDDELWQALVVDKFSDLVLPNFENCLQDFLTFRNAILDLAVNIAERKTIGNLIIIRIPTACVTSKSLVEILNRFLEITLKSSDIFIVNVDQLIEWTKFPDQLQQSAQHGSRKCVSRAPELNTETPGDHISEYDEQSDVRRLKSNGTSTKSHTGKLNEAIYRGQELLKQKDTNHLRAQERAFTLVIIVGVMSFSLIVAIAVFIYQRIAYKKGSRDLNAITHKAILEFYNSSDSAA